MHFLLVPSNFSKFQNLILCQNREEGIREAEQSNFDTVILDDGLQDYKIKKNLSIVCFNQNQLLGYKTGNTQVIDRKRNEKSTFFRLSRHLHPL